MAIHSLITLISQTFRPAPLGTRTEARELPNRDACVFTAHRVARAFSDCADLKPRTTNEDTFLLDARLENLSYDWLERLTQITTTFQNWTSKLDSRASL